MPQTEQAKAIIVVPGKAIPERGGDPKQGVGYAQSINGRPYQEDAVVSYPLTNGELGNLTPIEIGHRLWTTYQQLDEQVGKKPAINQSGCTASTTVYDGKGNLITANIADAASFAVVYNTDGDPIRVVRLNSVVHKPTGEKELQRIQEEGGLVLGNRVMGSLAVSRAIGDYYCTPVDINGPTSTKSGEKLITPAAQIDITNMDELTAGLPNVGKVQVISVSDGFTDAAPVQSAEGHAQYLKEVLGRVPGIANKKSEEEIAKHCVDMAIRDGSSDNASALVKTVKPGVGFLMGVFDGHGGAGVAIATGDNIGPVFVGQCALGPKAYAEQPLSTNNKRAIYERDNRFVEEAALKRAAAPTAPARRMHPAFTPPTAPIEMSDTKPLAAPPPGPMHPAFTQSTASVTMSGTRPLAAPPPEPRLVTGQRINEEEEIVKDIGNPGAYASLIKSFAKYAKASGREINLSGDNPDAYVFRNRIGNQSFDMFIIKKDPQLETFWNQFRVQGTPAELNGFINFLKEGAPPNAKIEGVELVNDQLIFTDPKIRQIYDERHAKLATPSAPPNGPQAPRMPEAAIPVPPVAVNRIPVAIATPVVAPVGAAASVLPPPPPPAGPQPLPTKVRATAPVPAGFRQDFIDFYMMRYKGEGAAPTHFDGVKLTKDGKYLEFTNPEAEQVGQVYKQFLAQGRGLDAEDYRALENIRLWKRNQASPPPVNPANPAVQARAAMPNNPPAAPIPAKPIPPVAPPVMQDRPAVPNNPPAANNPPPRVMTSIPDARAEERDRLIKKIKEIEEARAQNPEIRKANPSSDNPRPGIITSIPNSMTAEEGLAKALRDKSAMQAAKRDEEIKRAGERRPKLADMKGGMQCLVAFPHPDKEKVLFTAKDTSETVKVQEAFHEYLGTHDELYKAGARALDGKFPEIFVARNKEGTQFQLVISTNSPKLEQHWNNFKLAHPEIGVQEEAKKIKDQDPGIQSSAKYKADLANIKASEPDKVKNKVEPKTPLDILKNDVMKEAKEHYILHNLHQTGGGFWHGKTGRLQAEEANKKIQQAGNWQSAHKEIFALLDNGPGNTRPYSFRTLLLEKLIEQYKPNVLANIDKKDRPKYVSENFTQLKDGLEGQLRKEPQLREEPKEAQMNEERPAPKPQ